MNDEQEKVFLESKAGADVYLIQHYSSQPDEADGTEYKVISTTIEPEVTLFDDVKAWRVRGSVRKDGKAQTGLLGDYGYYLTQDGVLLKRGPDGPYDDTSDGKRLHPEVGERYRVQYSKTRGV